MRPVYLVVPAMALALAGVGAVSVSGQERQGRYTMSPVDNGFVRLDTETGAMALCGRRDSKWVCEPMDDEAQALRSELDRLRAENKRLQALAAVPPSTDGGLNADRPPRELELPSEQDIDKAFDYVERMFRKFRERIKEFDKDEPKGTPL